jgi:hypothetical protein
MYREIPNGTTFQMAVNTRKKQAVSLPHSTDFTTKKIYRKLDMNYKR